jgi:methylthioribose-1-phosphate isomerase
LITLDLKSPSPPSYLTSREKLNKELDITLDFLNTARPTAVNLGTAVRRLKKTIHDGIVEEKEPRSIAQDVVSEARAIHDEDLQRNKDMAKWAGDWILKHHNVQNGVNILTVCNTGSLATSVRSRFLSFVESVNHSNFTGLRDGPRCDHVSLRDG